MSQDRHYSLVTAPMKSFLGTHRRCTASVALAFVSSLLVLWLASGDLVGLLAPTAVVAFLCLTLITWTGIWYGTLTVSVLLKRRHRRCAASVALAFVSLLLVLWLASGDLGGGCIARTNSHCGGLFDPWWCSWTWRSKFLDSCFFMFNADHVDRYLVWSIDCLGSSKAAFDLTRTATRPDTAPTRSPTTPRTG